MKKSDIQLLQTSLLKLSLEPVPDSKFENRRPSNPFEYAKVVLETSKECTKLREYWTGIAPPVESIRETTYHVQLGLRTPAGSDDVGPYRFEIVCSAVIVVMPDRKVGKLTDDDVALQYGLTLLYGIIREQISTLTYKMPWGQVMLPTLTFLDEKTPLIAPVDAIQSGLEKPQPTDLKP
jgi:hypothetical protein